MPRSHDTFAGIGGVPLGKSSLYAIERVLGPFGFETRSKNEMLSLTPVLAAIAVLIVEFEMPVKLATVRNKSTPLTTRRHVDPALFHVNGPLMIIGTREPSS